MAAKRPKNDKGMGLKTAASRSGLDPQVILIWEERYGVIESVRTHGGRRLYSESELHRLSLLNAAVQAGHRIGDLADKPTDKLEKLVARAVAKKGRTAAYRRLPRPVR